MSDGAPTFDDAFRAGLATLFAWRRDVRRFKTDALPDGTLASLLDIAASGPSVGNSQPWRFQRIGSHREVLAAHVDAQSEAAAARYDAERAAAYRALKLHGLREAPEILAVWCDERPTAGHGLGTATMPEALRYSTVMAIHTLWLAARAEGIGVGWVSILDPAAISTSLDAPADWTLIAILCLGYPEGASRVPELERQGWQAREAVRVERR